MPNSKSGLTGTSTWLQICEIALVAPQVVAYRSARIVTGGWPPSARDRLEYKRMVTEKIKAMGQISAAVLSASTGGGVGALKAPIGPMHRKILANRRRPSRH